MNNEQITQLQYAVNGLQEAVYHLQKDVAEVSMSLGAGLELLHAAQAANSQRTLDLINSATAHLSKFLDKIGGEARVQRSDAANKFEKIAAHSVGQRLEANLILEGISRDVQAIKKLQDKSLHELGLMKMDIEFMEGRLQH